MTESYAEQVKVWPRQGRHVLAQFDADTVVVYQAYNPTIGRHAAEHGAFGGDFSYSRMSWIKTNFLWMPDHAVRITAARLERPTLNEGFDRLFTVRAVEGGGFEVTEFAGGGDAAG